ncbi:MAG: hypothetical protein ABIO39_13945, partial [Caulobacteraceae bacterium]
FTTKAAAVRQIAGQVASTLASARRPNLLSAKARKDGYKVLQDNAAKAKAVAADIDQLVSSIASATERSQLSAADAKLAEIKVDLNRLYGSSREAAAITDGQ